MYIYEEHVGNFAVYYFQPWFVKEYVNGLLG